jgi:Thioredoxin
MAGDATAVGTFGAVLVRIGIAVVLIAVAIAVAFVLQRRRPVAPPRDVYPVPRQLDRQDFLRAETPWLVALFSSTTCESCDGLMAKVAALESADVATCEIEYHSQPDVHNRYEIAGIPTTVVADGDGVVRAAFVGAFTATDLWAAVAEARAPGSTPEPELGELT